MKRRVACISILTMCVMVAWLMIGCEGSDGGGTAAIGGNVTSFDTGSATFRASSSPRESLWASVWRSFTDMLVQPAVAGAGAAGVSVQLRGPANASATTGDDGTFEITGLPAGNYEIEFSYGGQQIRYRGRSGQMAMLTLHEGEMLQLQNIRVSGGKVNIGNIKRIEREREREREREMAQER